MDLIHILCAMQKWIMNHNLGLLNEMKGEVFKQNRKFRLMRGNDMEYKENVLCYEDYCNLRESVGWLLFSKEQTKKALRNSLYTVIAVDGNKIVGMGRLIGDGMYYIMVDVVVCPAYQGKGIGTNITNRLIDYVDSNTPIGGRSSIQLIAEKGKELFYEKVGFKRIPHDYCGSGMRKVIHK